MADVLVLQRPRTAPVSTTPTRNPSASPRPPRPSSRRFEAVRLPRDFAD